MADDETQDESAADAEAIAAMNETSDALESEEGDATAEPDEADGEGSPAPPPEPEDFQAPPGLTERELEANHRKIETARKNFYNRISEIMGEDAQQLVECPACSYFVPGLIFPVEFDDSVKVALWSYMGLPDPNYYEDAPDRRQCPTCKGKTKVKTGSLDSVWALGKCRTCGGKGFVDDLLPVQIDNDTNGALPDAPFEVAPPMPEDEAWIEAARARGYTIVPPFEQPHA
jgi:hypothetical protein